MCHTVRGKRTRFWWAGRLCWHSILEEALSESLCREVLELKFFEHILDLPQSYKDKIFSKNFFLFVQTSAYLSETSLLLNLQCVYEHQKLIIFPVNQKINISGLILAHVLKCPTHENWEVLSCSPSLFLCPFPSVNDACSLQIQWADLHSFGLYSASNDVPVAHVNDKVGRLCRRYPSAECVSTQCCW